MQVLHFIVGLALFISAVVSASDRMMGWNKAHGLWGKRSASADSSQDKRTPQNWNKLNSLWGKRSLPMARGFDDDVVVIDNDDDVAGGYYVKRSAQWQRANGLWGK